MSDSDVQLAESPTVDPWRPPGTSLVATLAMAWLAHGALDGLHMLGAIETRVPYWYPGACLGWDAVLGLAGLHWANALDRPVAPIG